MSIEYKISIKESDLITDVSERMRKKFPALTLEESRSMATRSVSQMRSFGNRAVYDGLVEIATQRATSMYEHSGENRSRDEAVLG